MDDDGRVYIEQFMWPFQQLFRARFGYLAERAFKTIGMPADPRVLLIGFAESVELTHSICIEPEDGPFEQAHFADVLRRADELFAVDDDRKRFVTGQGQQELFEKASLDKSRGAELERALLEANRELDHRYFVGRSSQVGGYRVFPVLSVLGSRWAELPMLPDYDAGRLRIPNSFPQELVWRILDVATTSLTVGEDPSELISAGRDSAADVVRLAASAFVDAVPMRMGGIPSELMESLDALSIAPYEGRPSTGRIAFVPHQSSPDLLLEFDSTVRLRSTRQARKLLEMTSINRYLASNGEDAIGLIAQPSAADEVFEVVFSGRGSWTLSQGAQDYLRVDQGRPFMPSQPLSVDLFRDNFDRLFNDFPGADADAAWKLVQVAARQEHGTMLVIHADAGSESDRLGGQAVKVSPISLEEDSLFAASRIDGAVLISPDAKCHAIGVILDGLAGSSGDPGRGARFNSAARYVEAHRDKCLILVVSEDGSIEIVPTPRRRVRRAFIARVVNDVLAASEGEVKIEEFNRLVNRALAHSFYLSEEQCDQITTAREAVESNRKGDLRMIVPRIIADPSMDDSYFIAD